MPMDKVSLPVTGEKTTMIQSKSGLTTSTNSDLETSASFPMPAMDLMLKSKLSVITNIFGSLMNKGNGNRCKPKCYPKGYGSGGYGKMKMSVMPGLGDKQAEREVKKYVDENTLSMLLMKAIATSGNINHYSIS